MYQKFLNIKWKLNKQIYKSKGNLLFVDRGKYYPAFVFPFLACGFSSKINYLDHVIETIKIRKDNGQPKLLVYLITLIKYYYNRHRFQNKKVLKIIFNKIFFE